MTSFYDLFLRNAAGPEAWADPTWVDSQFDVLVNASPLRCWRAGGPILAKGDRLLIGVAPWSGYDMRLLDVIVGRIAHNQVPHPLVEVFNTGDCRSMSDFKKYIPPLSEVYQMPVTGVWDDGTLAEWGQGFAGRELAARRFGSSAAEIVQFVDEDRKARLAASRS